jgi:flagellar M-ring protein FliF
VVLAMQGAQRLDRDGVQAVLHLVATAVPGLKPGGISIVDSRGELLARGGQALSGPAQAGANMLSQEEMRRAHEMRIGRSVEELLERTLGPAGSAPRPPSRWTSTASKRRKSASTPRTRCCAASKA